MAHVRTTIRGKVVTLLTGLASTAARVYPGRSLPLEGANLPALCVYTRNDEPDYGGGVMPRTPLRVVDLVAVGYAEAADGTLDDALDTIAAEVETALFADPTLTGSAAGMELGEQALDVTDEGNRPAGVIEMSFKIFYRVVEGSPETPAN